MNRWTEKPCAVGLDALPKAAPGMMVQQLSGVVVAKRFVDGGFTGRWPFAVVMRVDGRETGARLEAVAQLNALAKWLCTAPHPALGPGRQCISIEMTGLPAQAALWPDGTEDYQAVFTLQYKEDGKDG